MNAGRIIVAEAFRHLPVVPLCDWPSDEELDLYARATEAGLSWETAPTKVIQLAERAQDVIAITELEPNDGTFIGKHINPDGHIEEYPNITWWRQRVACVPANIPALFAYLREARKRNICLIRGAPANLERQPTRRWRAHEVKQGKDRGDHGFVDAPSKLFWFDVDGAEMKWKVNPEGAVKNVVAQLGEPWASTSFVWFFSATHGLERDERKRWTGEISDGVVRVRLAFITERALTAGEASALTKIAQARVSIKLDSAITRVVQPNYIQRPHCGKHPNKDVLGGIPTIGDVRGEKEIATVPDDLPHTARWAKAQGHDTDVADHPDAESAVRGIGDGGEVRPHVTAAVLHLLRANPVPEVVSFADHSIGIIAKLQNMIAQHREEICDNLIRNGRSEHVVDELLQHTKPDFALWCLNHQGILRAKTIKLSKEERAETDETETREAIFARVERTIERSRRQAMKRATLTLKGAAKPPIETGLMEAFGRQEIIPPTKNNVTPMEPVQRGRGRPPKNPRRRRQSTGARTSAAPSPPITLLVAPTGSRKSTLMRDAAVRYVTEQPKKTVIILVPRHRLGDEQIDRLREEHPDGNYSAAVWRGRRADDPETPDPQRPGKYLMKMCRRAGETEELEMALLDVEHHLCKQGRGKKAIKCPFYDTCAYQGQKQIKANIWFAAHECATHEMPKVFGDVGWVIFDESPLNAFMFGVDINKRVTLALDTLRTPLPVVDKAKFGVGGYSYLMQAREELYRALDNLRVPIEFYLGTAVPRQSLKPFVETISGYFIEPKNRMFDTMRGEFTEAAPNLDAIRDRYSKTDPKPFIDAFNDEMLSDFADDLKLIFEVKYDSNPFIDAIYGTVTQGPDFFGIRNLTWRGKVKPDIRPDMLWEQIKTKLEKAAGNYAIKREVTLWELIEAAGDDKLYGRMQVHRGQEGRMIRMVGMRPLAKGWGVQTLICDATGDAELLKAIWPQLEEPEPHGWQQLPRPQNVRVFQCIDRTISKWAVAVEGKNEKEIARKAEGARRLYAAVLMKALVEYGGAEVGVITYKSTKEWIEKNCFVPPWLKLMHWGDLTGTNALQGVRALFVIGRPLAAAEDVTRQTEALFGTYIPQRDYIERRKHGRIPIVPDVKGHNTIRVDVREHPHRIAERLRRQITEGALIQAVGRARAGLREADEPLDIHLWTDVPVPELGPVEPVLWSELEAGLDGVMLGSGGMWFESIPDAAKAYEGLFSADGLKSARARQGWGGEGVLYIGIPISETPSPRLLRYRRAGKGRRPRRALALMGPAAARVWLEERLGPLAYFAEIREAAA